MASRDRTPQGQMQATGDDCVGRPHWHDTWLCGQCQSLRSYVGFRSHCRICGKSVCHACTASHAPSAWLAVPFVQLCDGIPATHRRIMKCCTACAQQAQLDELDYVWARVLRRTLPAAVASRWRSPPEASKEHEGKEHEGKEHEGKEEAEGKEEEEGEEVKAAREAYLCAKGDEVRGLLERLTSVSSAEFACVKFAHGPLEHRLVSLDDGTLHAFDLVYGTPKLARASKDAVQSVKMTFTLLVTMLSRPMPHKIAMEAVNKPEFLDLLPSVYGLVHQDNAAACLKLLAPQQHMCLYLHRPKDLEVGLAMPASARQVADMHLDTVAKLAAVAATRDDLERAALVRGLGASPVVIVRGERFSLLSVGYSCTGVLELACTNTRTTVRVLFFAHVQRGLVDAVAFIYWLRTYHVFQSMTVLPDGRAFLLVACAPQTHDALRPTHTYPVGSEANGSGAGAGVKAIKEGGGNEGLATVGGPARGGGGGGGGGARERDDTEASHAMWTTLQQAEPKSVMLQCVALTFQQTAEGKEVDTSRLRFFLDATKQLFVYHTGDSDAFEPSTEDGPWDTRVMLQEAVDKVRADSVSLIGKSREFVFWATVLVTGNSEAPPLAPAKLMLFSF